MPSVFILIRLDCVNNFEETLIKGLISIARIFCSRHLNALGKQKKKYEWVELSEFIF